MDGHVHMHVHVHVDVACLSRVDVCRAMCVLRCVLHVISVCLSHMSIVHARHRPTSVVSIARLLFGEWCMLG